MALHSNDQHLLKQFESVVCKKLLQRLLQVILSGVYLLIRYTNILLDFEKINFNSEMLSILDREGVWHRV